MPKKKEFVKDIEGVYEKGKIVAAIGTRVKLPLAIIDRNPRQPREYFEEKAIQRMAATYSVDGDVDIPIGVSIQHKNGRCIIVYGERRYRAGIIAGIPHISCYIEKPMSEIQLFKKSLRENVLREEMSPVEQAKSYKRIMDAEGLTVEEMAEEYGQSKGVLYELLKYLKLHPKIQQLVIHRKIDKGIAKRLTNYPVDKQIQLLGHVMKAVETKGGPLTTIEAMIVIRRGAEGVGLVSRPGRGKKNMTLAELIARGFNREAIKLVKTANDFMNLPDEQLVKLTNPSCAVIDGQLEYLLLKLKKARERIGSIT